MPQSVLTQLLLALAVAILVPSVIGAGAYLIFRWRKPTASHLLGGLGIYFLIMICMDVFVAGAIALAIGAAISRAGAKAHSKSMERYESGWESPHHLVLLATMLSLLVGWAAIISTSIIWTAFALSGYLQLLLALYFLTLLAAPSIMPFLIWMLQSSVLRPGVDRHFEAGDAAETK